MNFGLLLVLVPFLLASFSVQAFPVPRPTRSLQDKKTETSRPGKSSFLYQASKNGDNNNNNNAVADDILAQLAGGINLSMRKEPYSGSKATLVLEQAGDYNRQAVQSKIKELIDNNPVAIITFTECPYCIEARSILNEISCDFAELNLDTVGGREKYAYRAELYHMTGRTSVPAIWIGGYFVGGCNDGPMGGLMGLKEDGRLDGLL